MLVLIGGEIANGETLAIDRYIVEFCGRSVRTIYYSNASGEPKEISHRAKYMNHLDQM